MTNTSNNSEFKDEKTISLSEDSTAVALSEIKNLMCAMATLAEYVKTGRAIEESFARNLLAVSEHYLADLGKAVGVDTVGAKEILQRTAMLREANERVRQLERQLGETQSPESAQMQIKNLTEQLRRWWKLEGFGHVSEAHFGAFGCEVKFSCMLMGDFLLMSPTPVSDKSRMVPWYESLAERGYVLKVDDGDRSVVDSEQSRTALCRLLKLRFPTATIQSINNVTDREDGFVLRDVTVFIRDISEIAALPVIDDGA